ncbi:MAG TPA: branched-chain amino acid ABC transporter permease [Anaeromyxobacteraceae bacterium]
MAPWPGHDASRRTMALAVAVALLALFPVTGLAFYLELITKVMILAIFAMSLDLLVGCTGLVSLGHAAYFGIGAYVLALGAPRYQPASLWLTLPAAVATAALAALLVGALVVRVKSIYFIMATLAFAQMFYFLFHDTEFGRGSDGIAMNFRPAARLGGLEPFDLARPVHAYYFVLLAMLLVLAFLRRLRRSPFGRALRGIRANEQRMRSLGFPTYRYKLASFTIAGAIAGLAGYLSAMQYGFVSPELLSWHQSGNVLLMVILGGPGSFHGAMAGAFAFALLQEVYQSTTIHWPLLLGVTIILLVLFVPGGLSSLRGRLRTALLGGPADD